MNKKFILSILFLVVAKGNAQFYTGYIPDNYAGVQGVLFNPASIVDSRFKADINLFSVNLNLANDLYGVKIADVIKDDYDFETQAKNHLSNKNNAIMSLDVMGPSFMFNLAPKHAIAVYTRMRSLNNIVDVNGNLISDLEVKDSPFFSINGGSPNVVTHTWGEIGLSYAAVLLNNKQHFLKGGLTLKYLQGGLNWYLNGQDVAFTYVKNTTNLDLSTYTTKGTLAYGGSESIFEDFEFDPKSMGFGADFGLQYEWRPDYDKYDLSKSKPVDNNFKDLNKYKLRAGFSITDIGYIDYTNKIIDAYNFDGIITERDLNDTEDLNDLLKKKYQKIASGKGENVKLPTALHTDIDWNIYKKFYLNARGDFSLTDKSAVNDSGIGNSYSLTPRYETKWFTFAIPFNRMQYSGNQVGASMRVGPIFVGSSSAFTNLFSSNSKAVDVFFGLKIPIYQKKFKDRDGDNVIDKVDACRNVAGPEGNKGCPWPDTDRDSVLDKDDKCPKVAGPVGNKGCPWGDTDKDTVLDNVDACPSVAGPSENKGCPWPDTDGDSVLDKNDKCPTEKGLVVNAGCPEQDTDKDGVTDKIDECPKVPGPVSNKGCPEVTAAVLKELKVQARSVYFITGKAVLQTADKGATDERLDAIKAILKNYPNAKFSIEGHTDNVGDEKSNQKLSEARAKAVMDALVAKGVNPANLNYKGYGESRPVSDNKTTKGRTENRRTEVIHIGTIYEGKL